jgi:hypothetical protein
MTISITSLNMLTVVVLNVSNKPTMMNVINLSVAILSVVAQVSDDGRNKRDGQTQ